MMGVNRRARRRQACSIEYMAEDVVHAVARIGVRELREQLSAYLDRARNGETIEVTDRGTPIAMLVPIPDERRALAEFIASGVIRPAERPWRPGRKRIPIKPGMPAASEVLDQQREDRF
jgi:prevent-host-death family protein